MVELVELRTHRHKNCLFVLHIVVLMASAHMMPGVEIQWQTLIVKGCFRYSPNWGLEPNFFVGHSIIMKKFLHRKRFRQEFPVANESVKTTVH